MKVATENRRIRILQLALEYPPNLRGGLGRHVHDLAHSLHDLAHSLTVNDCEVGVVIPGYSFKDGSVQVLGADIPKNSFPEDNDLPLLAALNLELAGGLFKAFTAGRWNLLHAHDWMTAPAACLAHHTIDLPIVTTIHADISEGRLAWERSLVNVSSELIVHSHHMREIAEVRYPGRKVKVIPGGVWAERFARPTGVVRHPRRLLFVGRLVPYKGCQELIRAVAILRREHGQDIELLIVRGWIL